MRTKFSALCLSISLLLLAAPAVRAQSGSVNEVVDRISTREKQVIRLMRRFSPRIETYVQEMKPDAAMGRVPSTDHYFLGRLDLSKRVDERLFLGEGSGGSALVRKISSTYKLHFVPDGFAQMTLMDANEFDRNHYGFTYVRREFLGDVRCLLFDVAPLPSAGKGRFLGRVWVEDQDYNVVRFNGIYAPAPSGGVFFHFDSWRTNVKPGLWLPSYIYSEESDLRYGLTGSHLRFKAQTRLWGYNLAHLMNEQEKTSISVDSPEIKDQSDAASDASPVENQREWEHEAEQNVIERLTTAGLLSPPSDLDKVLETVANNIEVTNNLDIEPPVHCRVLLTLPMESFTIGHTLVLSKGLIDVLPDEASLAMVISHQLAHILLGHRLDTKYSFHDRMLFPDEEAFRHFSLAHGSREEGAAEAKGIELLKNSPYKDKLTNATMFLKILQEHAPALPNLLVAFIGDPMASKGRIKGMEEMMSLTPQLAMMKEDQITALPLGGRTKVNPWDGHIDLLKARPVALLSERERMPFELTPMRPHLTRIDGPMQQVTLQQGN